MKTITVRTPTGQYSILLGPGLLKEIGLHLHALGFGGRCGVVTNPLVGSYYAEPVLDSLRRAGFDPVRCDIPDGEQHKTLATVASLYNQFLAAGLDRKSPILALGGGVLGDTAGFGAASYLRGVPLIQIPTTVLSMVDSSVGGKTGVDLPQGKNLVGAFKQPELVLIDPDVLQTLDPAEYRAGLAEVVKHGLIAAPDLFAALQSGDYDLTWLLFEAIMVKVRVVEEDPFEQGRRAVLNLGHTFGHAFEQLSNFELRHGEGVAMGLVCAADLAADLGYAEPALKTEIITLLQALELPTQHPGYAPEAIQQAMMTDKKKVAGQLRFILPRAIGDVDVFRDVPPAAVRNVLARNAAVA